MKKIIEEVWVDYTSWIPKSTFMGTRKIIMKLGDSSKVFEFTREIVETQDLGKIYIRITGIFLNRIKELEYEQD